VGIGIKELADHPDVWKKLGKAMKAGPAGALQGPGTGPSGGLQRPGPSGHWKARVRMVNTPPPQGAMTTTTTITTITTTTTTTTAQGDEIPMVIWIVLSVLGTCCILALLAATIEWVCKGGNRKRVKKRAPVRKEASRDSFSNDELSTDRSDYEQVKQAYLEEEEAPPMAYFDPYSYARNDMDGTIPDPPVYPVVAAASPTVYLQEAPYTRTSSYSYTLQPRYAGASSQPYVAGAYGPPSYTRQTTPPDVYAGYTYGE